MAPKDHERSRQSSKIETRPAPIGGLNARDSIANMPENDAIRLINWIPDTFGVRCRKGSAEWATNVGAGDVSSILPYFAPANAFPGGAFLTAPTTMPGALFAATDANIYTITSATNAPAVAIALSGNANAGWFSHCMLSNSAGTFLLACSEADGYFTFDGTNWLRRVAGGGAGQVSGVNPNNLVHVNVWKRRAFFVERDSARAWYLPADAISGAATSFDFGPLFKRGGSLAYTASWTIDAGEGIDDFFVAVSSNGEVLVYKGTDPDNAATFALQGNYPVGQIPVGRRAYAQYGGDLIIVSTDGITPLSMVTRGGSQMLVASQKEYSSKIRPLIGVDLRASFTTRGWQLLLHPAERLFLCSVPDYNNVRKTQYVMSTSVNEWCVFNDITMRCLGSIGGYTFAGTTSGTVLILFTSFLDNVAYGTSVGNAIRGAIVTAYSYFKYPALDKMFLMVRPCFLAETPPNVLVDIAVNFSDLPPGGTPTYHAVAVSLWGTALWGTALWGGGKIPYAEWASVGGVGFAGAVSMVTSCIGDTTLTAIDYMLEPGGPF